MKDEKSKYLIIDSTEMRKEIKENNVSSLVNAYDIFGKYNVPREYQKIIIKINNPFFSKYEAEEYTIGFPFDLTAGIITKENDKKYLAASNPSTYDWTKKVRAKVTFKTEVKYSTFEDVMSLLVEMDEKDYLFSYLHFINDFFDRTINLDLLEQLYNETNQNSKKTLKLYKKEMKKSTNI